MDLSRLLAWQLRNEARLLLLLDNLNFLNDARRLKLLDSRPACVMHRVAEDRLITGDLHRAACERLAVSIESARCVDALVVRQNGDDRERNLAEAHVATMSIAVAQRNAIMCKLDLKVGIVAWISIADELDGLKRGFQVK